MTPYDPPVAGDFIQAAVFDPGQKESTEQELTAHLRAMRDINHVNTVNVYALESWDVNGSNARKNALFTALASLRLKVIVRLERYDSTRFAFTVGRAAAARRDQLRAVETAPAALRPDLCGPAARHPVPLRFPAAQAYLSVFYGWDNSYDPPSYAQPGRTGTCGQPY
jgi:hypothetical protein